MAAAALMVLVSAVDTARICTHTILWLFFVYESMLGDERLWAGHSKSHHLFSWDFTRHWNQRYFTLTSGCSLYFTSQRFAWNLFLVHLTRYCHGVNSRAIAVIVGRNSIWSFQVFEFHLCQKCPLQTFYSLYNVFKVSKTSKLQLQTRPTFTAIALAATVVAICGECTPWGIFSGFGCRVGLRG